MERAQLVNSVPPGTTRRHRSYRAGVSCTSATVCTTVGSAANPQTAQGASFAADQTMVGNWNGAVWSTQTLNYPPAVYCSPSMQTPAHLADRRLVPNLGLVRDRRHLRRQQRRHRSARRGLEPQHLDRNWPARAGAADFGRLPGARLVHGSRRSDRRRLVG
jgi:hypothetical protein